MLGRYPNEVLIVAGEEDGFVAPEILAQWRERVASLSSVTLPGCDHFFMSGLGPLRRAIGDWLG